LQEHCGVRGKRRTDLTPREFAMLKYLMNNAIDSPIAQNSEIVSMIVIIDESI